MSAEDILHEAESLGLREQVLGRVYKLRQRVPSISTNDAYDIVWTQIRNENKSL